MNNFIKFITGVSPSIAVVLAASLAPWITSQNDRRKSKNSMLKERYEHLYLPYINQLLKFNGNYAELVHSRAQREAYVSILLTNLKYMDKETFMFISDLYNIHDDLTNYEIQDDEVDYEEEEKIISSKANSKNMDIFLKMFSRTTKSLLKEASAISQELSMPDIASAVEIQLDAYLQTSH